MWEQNKDSAIEEIRKVDLRIDYNTADVKWHDANDYFIYNELYFSEEAALKTRDLLDTMKKYLINLDPFYMRNIEIAKQNRALKEKIEQIRKEWEEVIKKEISPS